MPVETATYLSDLVATNPVHTDGLGQADSHLRLIKSTLQATFPNVNAAVTGTPASLNTAATRSATVGVEVVEPNGTTAGAVLKLKPVSGSGSVIFSNNGTSGATGTLSVTVGGASDSNPITALTLTQAGADTPSVRQAGNPLIPRGIITMWSGAVNAVPAGWLVCDGTNGTPDLRNRFVISAGVSLDPGAVGGANGATVTSSAAGAHSHFTATVAAGAFSPTATVDTQGSHSHGGAVDGHVLSIDEIPTHDHGIGFIPFVRQGGASPSINVDVGTELGYANAVPQGGSGAHTHAVSTDGLHSHNATVSSIPAHQHGIVSDGTHTHTSAVPTLPPYYALAFIMKS